MSKYKVGDKFVFEICRTSEEQGTTFNYFKNAGYYGISDSILDKMPKYPDNMLPEFYVEEVKKTAYETGMNEAWEIAKKICLLDRNVAFSCDELVEMFGINDYEDIMKTLKPQDAKNKIEAWEKEQEEKKKVHVGDVVRHKSDNGTLILVTFVCPEDGTFNGVKIGNDSEKGLKGQVYSRTSINAYEKTNKKFDMSKIFELAD